MSAPPPVPGAKAAGRRYPCPACGARLEYDPKASGLKCPYCGHQERVEAGDAAEVAERDFEAALARAVPAEVVPEKAREVRCDSCGAVVLFDGEVVAKQCPFCLGHLSDPEAARAVLPPESLLPFAVDRRAAIDSFTKWLASLWFAPSALKSTALLGRLTGVYVPYWTYDSNTETRYTGRRGDHYWETEYYTTTDGQGNQKRESRQVRRTAWSPAAGTVEHWFDDLLVCGSKSVPGDLVAALEPWELKELAPFREDYLTGFTAERAAVGLEEGFERAKSLMAPHIDHLIRRDIGGDEQVISSRQTRYWGITFKPLLLPVWVAAYRFRDATFQILVNARTGKVSGRRPYSWAKIAAAVVFALAAAGVVAFVVSRLKK